MNQSFKPSGFSVEAQREVQATSQASTQLSSDPAQIDVHSELGKPRTVAFPVFLGGLGAVLLMGTILGGLLFSGPKKAEAAAMAKASAAANAPKPSPPEPKPKPKKTLAEQAIEGDAKAIETLQKRPRTARSVAETIALARVAAENKRKELAELERKITLVQDFGRQEESIDTIMDYAKDREVSVDTLHMLARLPKPIGPDFLYKVMSQRGRKNATKELAEELLYSKEIREKSSAELLSVLDLRYEKAKEQKDCAKVAKILDRALIDADRRFLRPMGSLFRKTGCGSNKREDCWPCLRDDMDLLKKAARAAAKRKAPL